uniref:Egg envelope protein n=1 Tax=Pantodon buchholzi TaxID=8276 RepID=A0A7R6VNT1_PANBU|nr:egg envelope protein [Pantodon buchholzi]
MGCIYGFWMLCGLIVTQPGVLAFERSPIQLECLDNLVRVTLDREFVWDKELSIDGIYGTQTRPITTSLAPVCGFSLKASLWGDVKIFASAQNCFAHNLDGDRFNTTLRLNVLDGETSQVLQQVISKTCQYTQKAFREVLCDRNYVEVSVKRSHNGINEQDQKNPMQSYLQEAVADVSEFKIWKMVLHTPSGDKTITVPDVEKHGYSLNIQPKRLVLRGPLQTAESYLEDVSGVPMQVLKSSMFFKQKWMVMQIAADAACPAGGVTFTEEAIVWTLPLFLSPIISHDDFTLLQVHMGVDGQRLDNLTMAARGYMLSFTDSHIHVQLPLGGVDGYYKSQVQDGQYHITFSIEPMLELLWQEDYAETKYKVLFPITTPLMSRPPHVVDDTVPQQKMFRFLLGTFLPDVVLVNLTFPNEVLTVAQAVARGFNLQERTFNNHSKAFMLEVPFSDPVVLTNMADAYVTVYTLPLLLGLLVLPEGVPLQHPVVLEARLQVLVVPTATGFCDSENFHTTVQFGSLGQQFRTTVGSRQLTPEVAEEYKYQQNATHFMISVPFKAADVVYEMVHESVIRGRLDLVFQDPINNWNLNDYSLACSFPMTMTACHPNGTISALAVKVESIPNLNLGLLSLRDDSCTPVLSNDRFAYFLFNANACGTTRRFQDNIMVYENEIALPGRHKPIVTALGKVMTPVNMPGQDRDYKLVVSCHYTVNTTTTQMTTGFNIRAQPNLPHAEIGVGEFMVRLKLAHDESYIRFYKEEHYPVTKLLRQPLYFEVELMLCIEPVELFLDNCWATAKQDIDSRPRWDIIVDSCENPEDRRRTVFHPMTHRANKRAGHFKRFEIKTFSFFKEDGVQRGNIYVHCSVVICDPSRTLDKHCNKPCMAKQRGSMHGDVLRRARRNADYAHPVRDQVSSGHIIVNY